MHTTIVIAFGLLLLALMLYIGERLGFGQQTLGYVFCGLWLALSVLNGAVGVVSAKQPLGSELLVGCLVFALPVAALGLYLAMGGAKA
ncbi:hypothetical protein QL104_01325 [Pseudomonas piscis]|uniref:Uncharacterized protein n=1 Tax=Pseudomonas piscis TaxID=2614538 RepID=A0ABY9NK66_9PSED|nr:hypothetical protein [Pseudomonas piscis]WMN18073.1 hypothetical protein QL104_01325 [Pseudomonas piscis]